MVFQEPMTSFSPVYTVGSQIMEVLRLHQSGSEEEIRAKAVDMLGRVGMPRPEQKANPKPGN